MIQLHNGDAKATLQGLESNSIDGALLDPPAGVSFMGREWDSDKGGRAQWVAWLSDILSEVYRVMKPGSYALVWALPRTSHWTGTAIEDAGFELVDCINHVFGQGFPKSLDISKAIDKAMGEEREVVGKSEYTYQDIRGNSSNERGIGGSANFGKDRLHLDITAPSHPLAQLFDGYKTQLKPQHEVWWLAMKPRQGTFAENAMAWGVAGLNVDGCRIAANWDTDPNRRGWQGGRSADDYEPVVPITPNMRGKDRVSIPNQSGRYPGNVILSHSPLCACVGSREVGNGESKTWDGDEITGAHDGYTRKGRSSFTHKTSKTIANYGKETIPAYHCLAYCVCGYTWLAENLTRCPECESKAVAWSCPVRALDEMSGERKSGGFPNVRNSGSFFGVCETTQAGVDGNHERTTGGASRFFTTLHPGFTYQTKAPTRERFFLCHTCGDVFEMKERRNEHKGHNIVAHPTQKSLALMQHLVRLIMPPDKNATVLDCMCGTGSTLVAAHLEGYNAIGIELDADYYHIAQHRCDVAYDNETVLELEMEQLRLEL